MAYQVVCVACLASNFLFVRRVKKIELQSIDSIEAQPGDRLFLRTPGGGGVGDPELIV